MSNPIPESVNNLLKKRYFQDGEDWEQLCQRVSSFAGQAELTEDKRSYWTEKFFNDLYHTKYIPNTPALINAGTNHKGCVAACFTLIPEDNMDSIMMTAYRQAFVLKFGGGVGFNFSKLRPQGSLIQSTHKAAMGPLGVARFYSSVGIMVTQGGVRESAMMGLLECNHPDIYRFIRAKEEDGLLHNFNFSVFFTDKFINTLLETPSVPHVCEFNNQRYLLLPDGESILEADRGSRDVLSTQDLWDTFCKSASLRGDPGLAFIDEINRNNPLIKDINDTENPNYINCLNPCAEATQTNNEACLLISVDLGKFIKDKELDWDALSDSFYSSTRMINDLSDVSDWPTQEIEHRVKSLRRIGVGVMGFTTMLERMGIKYGSQECMSLIQKICDIRTEATDRSSLDLGEEKGPFPLAPEGCKYRNVERTIVAPTGSIAQIADTSWSIEPNTYWAFIENRMGQSKFRVLPSVEENISKERLNFLISTAKNIVELNEMIQKELPDHFVLAKDLTWKQHIDVMAEWQKGTGNAISKTIVLTKEQSTPSEISKLFLYAWKNKIKGLTIYPEGSRQNEPMSLQENKKDLEITIPRSFFEEILESIDQDSLRHKLIQNAMRKYLNNELEEECPECKGVMKITGRCSTCISCGYSKCG